MDQPIEEKRPDICHRCLQPVMEKARRCPHCSHPIQRTVNARLMLGLLGLMVFVVVAIFAAVGLTHSGNVPSDDNQRPVDVKPALGQ